MERPAKKAQGEPPTPQEVERCDPLGTPPQPPPDHVAVDRCLRANQAADDEIVDRRFVDTKWILNSDGPADPDHFLTTHQHFFARPGACPEPGARRARLLYHYLLHRHALRVVRHAVRPLGAPAMRWVHHEAISEPEVEPYVSEYTESFFDADFKPTLEAELERPAEPPSEIDARHPLYEDAACSYWYQKQSQRGSCFDRVTPREDPLQPFRRNALFTTPLQQTLYEPPTEAPFVKAPRHTYRVNHDLRAPY